MIHLYHREVEAGQCSSSIWTAFANGSSPNVGLSRATIAVLMSGKIYSASFAKRNTLITWQKINRKIKLLEYKIPDEGDYIILESFQKHGDKKVRFLHVINFSNNTNKINIGRSNDCETRIVDISVSRHHSVIRKENDGIWIWDANSKFGTLLYKSEPSLLVCKDPQYVQWGSCLLIVQLERPCCNWCLCLLKPSDIENGINYK